MKNLWYTIMLINFGSVDSSSCGTTSSTGNPTLIPIMDNQNRCNYVFMAKLTSEAERFDDMAKFMAELVVGLASEEALTKEECLLFSKAYEKVVALKREALLTVMDNGNGDLVKEYCSKLKAKLLETCATASRLVDTVIPSATSPESEAHCVEE
ncbi:hypothetical protein RJ639_032786 [Escallonia herrerae]|uniref:14-3-3 domain-containing protein n=1 Tax=Escallonia herrerae TaxID=1293975 RepID=A0AA88WU73_9ASTE|nr:hypothetical protein RJ639_032786 [Escallonia herrerae]